MGRFLRKQSEVGTGGETLGRPNVCPGLPGRTGDGRGRAPIKWAAPKSGLEERREDDAGRVHFEERVTHGSRPGPP